VFTFDAGTAVDSWASFPESRDRLFADLEARGIGGVVLVSGDIHHSEIRRWPRPSSYDLYEIVSSPLAQYSRDAHPGRDVCGSPRGERLYCYSWDSWVSARAGPTSLELTVFDEDGAPLFAHTLDAATLTP
jgi:hypothetical protein